MILHKKKVSILVNIDRIKELAKERGIKIKYLCSKLGLAETYLSNVKNGKDRMTDERLAIIARELGTTVEYLRDETDVKTPEDNDDELNAYLEELKNRPEMRMLFSLAKGATKKDVEQAAAIIEALRKGENG